MIIALLLSLSAHAAEPTAADFNVCAPTAVFTTKYDFPATLFPRYVGDLSAETFTIVEAATTREERGENDLGELLFIVHDSRGRSYLATSWGRLNGREVRQLISFLSERSCPVVPAKPEFAELYSLWKNQ